MGQVSFAEDTKIPDDTHIEEEQPSVYKYQDGPENKSWAGALPLKQGLYDPELEKDACGVGFAAWVTFGKIIAGNREDWLFDSHIKGKASHKIVSDGKGENILEHTINS
jgi:glutamate synthase (NADPH/NADH)